MHTIWHTDHIINRTVTRAFYEGMQALSTTKKTQYLPVDCYKDPVPSISYGILRGTGEIFNDCIRYKKEWWEIDRGYFKPGHFDGYYRISLNAIRASYRKIDLPRDRLNRLGITYAPWKKEGEYILLCPPTSAVSKQTGVQPAEVWLYSVNQRLISSGIKRPFHIRLKESKAPLIEDLRNCKCVITHNSNVAIDALKVGIPALATNFEGEISGWNKLTIDHIESDRLYEADREDLFRFLSYCQFTLDEMRSGYAWEKCQEVQKYGFF